MSSPQPDPAPEPEPARGPYPTRRPEPVRPVPPPRPSKTPARIDGESREDFIQRLVAAAPLLTEAQRARLRPVLAPMREPNRLAS